MKFIRVLIIPFIFLMFVSSCEFLGVSQTREPTNPDIKRIEAISDSVRNHLKAQDSLSKALVEKIDTITVALNESKNQIEKLDAHVSETKSPIFISVLTFIAFLLSIVSIFITILKTTKMFDRVDDITKVKENLSKQINNLNREIMNLNSDLRELNRKYQIISDKVNAISIVKNSYDYYSSEKENVQFGTAVKPSSAINGIELSQNEKIQAEIERKRRLVQSDSNEQHQQSILFGLGKDILDSQLIKYGYAPIHTGKYLVDIVDSKQESCVYSLKFTSKSTAVFDIISLEKIKTINDLNDIIDFELGSCLLEEASSYTVIEKGQCQIIDEKTWEVTKKLKIKLSK